MILRFKIAIGEVELEAVAKATVTEALVGNLGYAHMHTFSNLCVFV